MVKVQYVDYITEVSSAAGAQGVLCKNAFDGSYFFRVYGPNGNFTDYKIRHDELEITISENELASFYQIDGNHILDNSPDVLGLEKNNFILQCSSI
jgi:hypothetical protein